MSRVPPVVVEVEFTAGVWTDVSADVSARDGVTMRVGRSSRGDDVQPGTLQLALDNSAGAYTPDSPLAAYWPNVVRGKAVRVTVAGSRRFLGTVREWLPVFDDPEPAKARVRVTATDALGKAAAVRFQSMLMDEIVLTDPSYYWPLTDPSGSTTANNVTAFAPSLTQSTAGTGVGTVTFGETAPGDIGGCVTFAPAGSTNGTYLTVPSTLSGPYWVEFWFRTTTANRGILRADGTDSRFAFTIDSSGFLVLRQDQYLSDYWITYTGTRNVADGQWHHAAYSEATLYLDGVPHGTYADGSPAAARSGVTVDVGRAGGTLFEGSIAHAFVDVQGHGATVAARYAAGVGGDTLQSRWGRVAALCGLAGSVDATWPARTAAVPRTAGKAGLAALQDVIRGESGYMWADPSTAATVIGRSRATARAASPVWTIDAEGDVDGGIVVAQPAEGQSRVDVDNGTFVVSRSDSSIDGGSTTLVAPLADSDEMAALATDGLAASRSTRTGIPRVRVDLTTSGDVDAYGGTFGDAYVGDVWSTFVALRLGDRVRVRNLPTTYLGTTWIDGYVEGWSESVDVNGWSAELDLSPADAPAEAVLDDATYGRVSAGGTMALTAGLTSSATSVQITTSSGPTLTTDAAAYPLDLDLNGERVTVASAPAGAASPQTVTVTRGIAPSVARAHSAGEPVDVWLAPGAAF